MAESHPFGRVYRPFAVEKNLNTEIMAVMNFFKSKPKPRLPAKNIKMAIPISTPTPVFFTVNARPGTVPTQKQKMLMPIQNCSSSWTWNNFGKAPRINPVDMMMIMLINMTSTGSINPSSLFCRTHTPNNSPIRKKRTIKCQTSFFISTS